MPNQIDIQVSVASAAADFDKLEAQAKRSGKGVGTALERGFDEGERASKKSTKQIIDDQEKIKTKTKETADAAGRSMADLGEALRTASGGLGDSIIDNLSGAKAAVGAGAAMLGSLVMKGITDGFARNELGGQIAAKLGEGTHEAARYGALAGEIYADNFGEELADVGDAIQAVTVTDLVDTDASDEAIKAMTEEAITAATVVGEEVGAISRTVRTMLMTGVADSATEAFDILTQAAQNGLNVSDDLLDTMDEYSSQFARMGLSAEESLGLVQQAMKGGARDTDFAADALKEFAIRAQDMSPTTARGFETIGLSASKMSQMMAAGGSSARDALGQTLDALRSMPPSLERNQAAVDLFGTKAEDLGDALFKMDLKGASKEFGNFADSTEDAARVLASTASPLENLSRNLGGVMDSMFAVDTDALESQIDPLTKGLMNAVRTFRSTGDISPFDKLKADFPEAAEQIDSVREKLDAQGDSSRDAAQANEVYVETLDQIISKNAELAGGVLSLREAQSGYEAAIDAATDAVEKNGATLDLNTEAGRDNQDALDAIADKAYDAATAMQAEGATAQEVSGHMKRARADFIAAARAMGMGETAANRLADQLGLIPGNYVANVQVRTAQAQQMINSLIRRMNQMPTEKVINMRVNTSYSGLGGHQLAGQAHGGAASSAAYGHAAEGGARGDLTLVNEQGPELQRLQNGSVVVPAGMSRALFNGAAATLGAGAKPVGGRMEIVVSGATDSALGQLLQALVRRGFLRLKDGSGQPVTVR